MSATGNLIDLWADIDADPAFDHLRTPGIRLVPGEGSHKPLAFIVGEAPGAMENTHGRPFVGASGEVLRQLMASAGLYSVEWYEGGSIRQDANVWLTNTIKYRPPGNRTPDLREVLKATPYLRQEWLILGRPHVVVTVGGVAWQALGPPILGSITRNAGDPLLLHDGKTWLWPMLHPAYGLRNPSVQPTMERHWEELGKWIQEELA